MKNTNNNEPNINGRDTNSPGKLSVDVIIPVYHPDDKFARLIKLLNHQTVRPSRIIILHTIERPDERLTITDSSGESLTVSDSHDEKLTLSDKPDISITVLTVEKKSFDHGGTRKYGASASKADILMFMTQDAVPADDFLIERLLKPLQ
jgi:rhamnosyltransferase